jgi:hypothetical protein
MQELRMKSRDSPSMHTYLFFTSFIRRLLKLDDRDGQLSGYHLLFGSGTRRRLCLQVSGLILAHLFISCLTASYFVRSFFFHIPQAWEIPISL